MYLFPHKPEWQSEFEQEKASLTASYGGEIKLFHIGSTAIKGLYAKDCIDILGVVEDIAEIGRFKPGLIKLGFDSRGEYGIPGRAYFSKTHRKVHLHIFQTGDINVNKHLNFIKTMRDNPKLITELNKLKLSLHDKYPSDITAYQDGKAHFYGRINKMDQI